MFGRKKSNLVVINATENVLGMIEDYLSDIHTTMEGIEKEIRYLNDVADRIERNARNC